MEARLRVYPQFIAACVLFSVSVGIIQPWVSWPWLIWNLGLIIWMLGGLFAFVKYKGAGWLILLGSFAPVILEGYILSIIEWPAVHLKGSWVELSLVVVFLCLPPVFLLWNALYIVNPHLRRLILIRAAMCGFPFLLSESALASSETLTLNACPLLELSEVDTSSLYASGQRPLGVRSFIVGKKYRDSAWGHLLDAPGPGYQKLRSESLIEDEN